MASGSPIDEDKLKYYEERLKLAPLKYVYELKVLNSVRINKKITEKQLGVLNRAMRGYSSPRQFSSKN